MTKRLRASVPLIIIALLLAGCGDDTDTAAGGDEHGDHSQHDGEHGEHGHEHAKLFELPEGSPIPTLEIDVTEDSKSGYNLFIETTDYTLTPEASGLEAVAGEGHHHVYVDGVKVARLYNQAMHLDGLEPGDHEISVDLSANDHSSFAVDGQKIVAKSTITVPEKAAGADSDHNSDHDSDQAHAMAHEPLDVAGTPPEVTLTVTEDPLSGWNVRAEVANFTITPAATGSEPVDGEGHLHLYVDGVKQARLYGEWWHIPALTEGSHEVMVELNANDHSPWAVDGDPIRAMTTIEVSADQASAEIPSADDADVAITVTVDGDDVTVESVDADGESASGDRVEVTEGQAVAMTVDADLDEMVHVHGFDIMAAVGPDSPAEVVFVADDEGLFEVELEESGRLLLELQITD